jgi:hypothetical protein
VEEGIAIIPSLYIELPAKERSISILGGESFIYFYRSVGLFKLQSEAGLVVTVCPEGL